jgi:hypothetical protein
MQLEYLLCYAAAGTELQFCAMKRGDKASVYYLGQRLDIATEAGKLICFESIMIITAIICAQRKQLRAVEQSSYWFQPLLGRVNKREKCITISYMDGYIEKRSPVVGSDRLDELIHVYNSVSGKPCIIQSIDKPCIHYRGSSYVHCNQLAL